MMLRATTLLADNTVPLLHSACASLQASGVPIVFDESLDLEHRTWLVEQQEVDLVWACGLLTARFVDAGVGVQVVAAPVFPDEDEPVYRSVIVCRTDTSYTSLREAIRDRVAINDLGSWSGWHGLVSYMQESSGAGGDAVPDVVLATGGHVNSIRAVAAGDADVAAIDSSVWRYVASEDPDSVAALHVLCTTGDWPAPPLSVLSTPSHANSQLHPALAKAVGDLAPFRPASISDYQFMLDAFGRTPEVEVQLRQG